MSRGPEANFWNLLRKSIPKKCHATRIENRVGSGVPDVHAVWDGLAFWIELKVTKTSAVRLSPHQIAWNTAYSLSGGLSLILVKHLSQGTLFLFEGHQAREIASEGLDKCTAIWTGRSAPSAWEAIGQLYDSRRPQIRDSGSGVRDSGSSEPVEGEG